MTKVKVEITALCFIGRKGSYQILQAVLNLLMCFFLNSFVPALAVYYRYRRVIHGIKKALFQETAATRHLQAWVFKLFVKLNFILLLGKTIEKWFRFCRQAYHHPGNTEIATNFALMIFSFYHVFTDRAFFNTVLVLHNLN